jgi:hypothetical protein
MSYTMRYLLTMLLIIGTLGMCMGCAQTVRRMEVPVMPYPTLQNQNLGQTTCSFNNMPVVLMDSIVLVSPDAEIILEHEQTHARRINAYKGGCWPFMLRYAKDSAFRADEEFIAYCAEGRFALSRNRAPEYAWQRIADIMLQRHNRLLTAKDNCLYEGTP